MVSAFDPSIHRVVVDGTLGRGGHSRALLESGVERIIGLDRDADAIRAARENLHAYQERVTLVHSPFSELPEVLRALGQPQVDGIFLDLGVSSHQLDTASRGFGFRSRGPLDMRMDQESGETAGELLDRCSAEELTRILRELGEVPGAWRIANRILEARREGELETTTQLASLVASVAPNALRKRKIHPATLVFQALRCAVNGELDELDSFLDSLPKVLALKGRVALMSFQSLEDRRVKWRYRELSGRIAKEGPAAWVEDTNVPEFKERTRKPLVATEQEIAENPRARSAKLRVLERVGIGEEVHP